MLLLQLLSYPGKVTQISCMEQKVLYVNREGFVKDVIYDFCPKGTERVSVSFSLL